MTSMGLPLSPIIAEIVRQDLEESVFKALDLPMLFYYWYVDNIVFAAQENDINYFLDVFNNYHKKLKFTSKKECGCSLSFLNLLLYKENNKICIDWFHKHFRIDFFCFSSKIRCVTKLERYIAYLIGPFSYQIHYYIKNIELCIQLFIDNGYSLELIFYTINRRFKKFFVIKRVNNRTPATISNYEKKVIVFPYIKPIIEIMTSTINKSNHIIGYRCLNKIE